jgi:hypothetical protein
MEAFVKRWALGIHPRSEHDVEQLSEDTCVFLDEFGAHRQRDLTGETPGSWIRVKKCTYGEQRGPVIQVINDPVRLRT